MIIEWVKRAAIALLLVAITGCATPSDIRAPISELKGKPLQEAIGKLGIPHNDQVVGGLRVVSYLNSETTKGEGFYCNIRLVVGDNDIVSDVEIKSNSAYYCPRLGK